MAVAEHRGRAMASEVHVVVVDGPADAAADVARHLAELEERWSRFLPDSDIARVNRAGGRPVPVHPETLTLVATMLAAWRATDGRCDASVLPALVRAGYAASVEDPRRRTVLPSTATGPGDLAAVEVDPVRGTVTAPAGTVLDPGAVGKGLAADLAVASALRAGAAGVLVGVGGDLSMAGRPPDGGSWVVLVEDPDRPPVDGPGDRPAGWPLTVSGGGVATSSTRSRRWTHQGRPRHHVIDPATGAPARTDLAAVTVVAPTGWEAEAHATAALMAGSGGVVAHLVRLGLAGVAVSDDGRWLATPGLARPSHLAGVPA